MAEKTVRAVEKTATVKEQNKKGLSYAEILKARAQRGLMTHQKKFAMAVAKKEEMKEK